ncbi:MAG: hypothetical protein ACPGRE_01990 [Flavobacteriaceae bacterium]
MKNVFLGVLFILGVITTQAQSKEQEAANANNPLANIKAFNIQFNFLSNNTSTDNQTMMTSFRYAQPVGKFLLRATLPTLTSSSPSLNSSMSGVGDFNLFATYLASKSDSPVQFGIGPMVYAPTSSVSADGPAFQDSNFGANNWQVGAAAIVFVAKNPKFQYGGLVTYVAGVGQDSVTKTSADESLLAIQPFYFFQLGKGTYLRGAPIWTINMQNDAVNLPVGIGLGQVMKIGNDVVNLFIEPQYSMYSKGFNQAMFQVFASINLQFY